jgi:hypothetical protein
MLGISLRSLSRNALLMLYVLSSAEDVLAANEFIWHAQEATASMFDACMLSACRC